MMSEDKVLFDPKLVRQLAKILNETDLNEIEYESNGNRIKVARRRPDVQFSAPAMLQQTSLPPLSAVSSSRSEENGKSEESSSFDFSNHPGAIKSPMVGIAYLAPEPGAKPFVQKGDTVSQGQTLCIIEAMKVMNPIRAPRDGKMAQILVQNSNPVEFDEVLFVIE